MMLTATVVPQGEELDTFLMHIVSICFTARIRNRSTLHGIASRAMI